METEKIAEICQARFVANTVARWKYKNNWAEEFLRGFIADHPLFSDSSLMFADLAKLAPMIGSQKLADLAIGLTCVPDTDDCLWKSRMREAIYQVGDDAPALKIQCLTMAALLDYSFTLSGGHEEECFKH